VFYHRRLLECIL